MGFRSDINGVRGVAVSIVVLYHLGVPGFQGGYVGVDVFFVLSGYLMTQVVLTKLAKGSFSVVDFYAARTRRLLPALLALTAVLFCVGFALLLPRAYAELCRSILAAVSFTSNIVFWQERGYFDAPSDTKWLLHTWSLSVEWQFYLLYPLLLRALASVQRGRFLGHGLAVSLVASLVLSIVATPLKPEAAFFLLPTRTWELLVGALLYLRQQQRPRPKPALAYLGLAMIVIATVVYGEKLAYPGAYAILPVLGAALVVAAHGDAFVLRNRPLQWLGDVSYSLYLWHWPVIVGARVLRVAFTPLAMIVMAALAVVLAVLSYRFVETPFRTRGAALPSARYLVRTLAMVGVVAVAAGVGELTRGLPARVPPLVAKNDAASAELLWGEVCRDEPSCPIGPAAPRKVLFWGDSHAAQLVPTVLALVEQGRVHGKQALFRAHLACMPVRGFQCDEADARCPEHNDETHARALADDVDTVVIASIWTQYFRAHVYDPRTPPIVCLTGPTGCVRPATFDDAITAVHAQLLQDVGELTARGKRVVLVQPVPVYDRDVPMYLAERAWSGAPVDLSLTRDQHNALVAPVVAMLRDVATRTGATLMDPADVLCAKGTCVYAQEGVALYKDDNHLATSGARLLAPELEAVFR